MARFYAPSETAIRRRTPTTDTDRGRAPLPWIAIAVIVGVAVAVIGVVGTFVIGEERGPDGLRAAVAATHAPTPPAIKQAGTATQS